MLSCRLGALREKLNSFHATQGLLADETHPPIVVRGVASKGAAPGPFSWEAAVDCAPMDEALAATDHSLLLAVYGGAKATDRYVSQVSLGERKKERKGRFASAL